MLQFECNYCKELSVALKSMQYLKYWCDYQVTRQEYESCHIIADRKAHMVVNCSNPLRRKRFTILFEEFQAIPNVAEFVPGSTYYYISEFDTSVHR